MLKDRRKDEAAAASGKMSRKDFEKELAVLQAQLTRLQTWVKGKGERVIVVFEGRDTAGKGGVISRITARTSPRVYRRRWWDYTVAYQRMIEATHTSWAPWHIVPADNKRRARLNLIRHLLDSIPYKKVDIDFPGSPRRSGGPRVLRMA